MNDESNPLKKLNLTGFPFQIAVMNAVGKAQDCGWQVKSIEHAWNDKREGNSGFIDLIVENNQRSVVFIIECKRHLESSWIFINEQGDRSFRRVVDALAFHYVLLPPNKTSFKSVVEWLQITVEPDSPIANFSTTTKRGQTDLMLEKLSSELIAATESFANEEVKAIADDCIKRYYFNVIVTNAELQVCSFDPQGISLDRGEIPQDAKLETVPCIRFRKQLSTNLNSNLSTVFIVNSAHFVDFLRDFEVNERYLEPILHP